MDARRFDRLFDRTPGAWYGNGPDGPHPGRIVVDPGQAVQAIRYLTRRVRLERVEPAGNGECAVVVVFRPR